jgi:hypothetical protein
MAQCFIFQAAGWLLKVTGCCMDHFYPIPVCSRFGACMAIRGVKAIRAEPYSFRLSCSLSPSLPRHAADRRLLLGQILASVLLRWGFKGVGHHTPGCYPPFPSFPSYPAIQLYLLGPSLV